MYRSMMPYSNFRYLNEHINLVLFDRPSSIKTKNEQFNWNFAKLEVSRVCHLQLPLLLSIRHYDTFSLLQRGSIRTKLDYPPHAKKAAPNQLFSMVITMWFVLEANRVSVSAETCESTPLVDFLTLDNAIGNYNTPGKPGHGRRSF